MFHLRQPVLTVLLAALFAALSGVSGRAIERLTITFDHTAIGQAPPEFEFAAQRQATPGNWLIQSVAGRRHLIHAGDPSVTERGMAVAAVSAPAPADVQVTARVRLVDTDRAGGLVWRYRDANNFYFLGIVLADHAVNLVRVIEGNRVLLAQAREANIDPEAWHTVTAVHQGDQIRGIVNGLSIVRARDSAIGGGRAGLWSAGNSTTWFDDLVIEDAQD